MDNHKKHRQILDRGHPGQVLEYELKRRKISVKEFAEKVNEFPIIIYDILEGRKKISRAFGKLIEKELNLEIGTFFLLNELYECIQMERAKEGEEPYYHRFRKKVFADVGYDAINWDLDAEYVVNRVFKIGNAKEKNEIARLYGEDYVNRVLSTNLLKHTDRLVKRPVKRKKNK